MGIDGTILNTPEETHHKSKPVELIDTKVNESNNYHQNYQDNVSYNSNFWINLINNSADKLTSNHFSNTKGFQTYRPPTQGRGQDWLLVIDDDDAGYPTDLLPKH